MLEVITEDDKERREDLGNYLIQFIKYALWVLTCLKTAVFLEVLKLFIQWGFFQTNCLETIFHLL